MSVALQKQNQKVLRQLMAIPANKKCCDCGEPVAANVDVTHGIFVCTACSGIHREIGDRIKSVSMASFTQDELALLHSHNNDTFNQQYLSRFNPSVDRGITSSSNDSQRRAFITAKYQEKRWFSGGSSRSPQQYQQQPAQSNPFSQPQPQQSNPFSQPQQQSNPFSQPQQQSNPFSQPAQPNPFAQPQPQSQPQQQQQWSPFGNQPSQPQPQQSNPFFSNAQPQQQPQQQQWSPFNNNQPQQAQAQSQPTQQRPYDDLLDLDFDNPSNPQVQKVQQRQEQQNQLKGLVDLMDDATPNTINGQPNINALRESGLGGTTSPQFSMTSLAMAGFGNFTQNPGMMPAQPFGPMGGYGASPYGAPPYGGANPAFRGPYGGPSGGYGQPGGYRPQ